MPWTNARGKVEKAQHLGGGGYLLPKDGAQWKISSEHIFSSREKARDALRSKKQEGDVVSEEKKESEYNPFEDLLERLGEVRLSEDNDMTMVNRVLRSIENLESHVRSQGLRVSDLEYESMEAKREASKLRLDIDQLKKHTVPLEEHDAVKKELSEAKVKIGLYKIRTEELRCHQVMLMAQRDRLMGK